MFSVDFQYQMSLILIHHRPTIQAYGKIDMRNVPIEFTCEIRESSVADEMGGACNMHWAYKTWV
jgi:hypothetical protein